MKMQNELKTDFKCPGESKFELKQPATEMFTEAHKLLSQPGSLGDMNVNRAVTAKALEHSGVLPSLLVSEMSRLDSNRDGYLSRQELTAHAEGPKEDPVVASTARHALNHFDEIRRSGSWLSRQFHSSDTLSQDQITAYEQQARTAPPQSQMKTGY